MSCEYCKYHRDMIGDAGSDAERICIDRIIRFRGSVLVGYEYCINVELPEGYATTLPITYCPMCGERLEGDWDDER